MTKTAEAGNRNEYKDREKRKKELPHGAVRNTYGAFRRVSDARSGAADNALLCARFIGIMCGDRSRRVRRKVFARSVYSFIGAVASACGGQRSGARLRASVGAVPGDTAYCKRREV